MIDQRFLTMLRCPIDGTQLANADAQQVSKLNALIAAGNLRDRGDQKIQTPIDGALMTVDEKHIYPIRNEIPTLIADEAILFSVLEN